MISKAIFARLSASGTQTQAIVADRVYPDLDAAPGAVPFVVYDPDDGETDQTYAGPSGLARHIVTISAIAESRLACESLVDAIRADLDGQDGTWGGVEVPGAFMQNGNAEMYPLTDGSERRLYGKDIQFLIWTRS